MANERLEQLLDEIKKSPEQGVSREFSERINQTVFLMPALLPRDTDPKIMRQMLDARGDNQPIPKGANPQPCLLENKDKDKFLPLFTSSYHMEQGGKNAPVFPLILNVPFVKCMELLQKNQGIKGAVINPFTHNVVVPRSASEKIQKTEITIDEYHIISRQKFEAQILPGHLFMQKGELARKISREKGQCIREMYEEAYSGEIACPYTEDDFDFISMQITDDLLVVQITMPKKYAAQNTASNVILGWDEKKEKIWYFAVIHPAGGNTFGLVEKMEDGSAVAHGEAPEEGSIISEVIRRIQGSGE